MAAYSTATAVEPRALTALFKNREDADSAYEWLLKNGYNSNDIHLLMSEDTRQKYHYAEATEPETTVEETHKLEHKIREGSILISARPHSDEDAELIESAWRDRGGELVQY